MVASGFNPKTCEDAYNANDASELRALAYLVSKLCATDKSASSESSSDMNSRLSADEVQQQWEEEMEALESIFGTSSDDANAFTKDRSRGTISIKIKNNLHPDAFFELGIPEASQYPNELPAMWVKCPSLPAYIRLGILRALALEAGKNLGAPMVYSLVCWLEETFDELVEKPPSLISLAVGRGVQDMVSDESDQKTRKGKAQPNSTTVAETVLGGAISLSSGGTGYQGEKGSGGRKKQSKFSHVKDDKSFGEMLQKEYQAHTSTQDYQRMLKFRQKLPSYQFRDKIISTVQSSQVIIICGETGCGKSTQTGQFILESQLSSGLGGSCNIICTQPRRISATSLAERVAAERAEDLGVTIGYTIRGETIRSDKTRLSFCTTGILLRMLQGDPSLQGVSHVIVDEVHERSVDSDFLLVILKDLLLKRPDFRLILMSATIDSETFAKYFRGAPVLEIPGFTHPVTDVYLEDILVKTGFVPEPRLRNRAGGVLKPLANVAANAEDEEKEKKEDGEIEGRNVKREDGLKSEYEKLRLDPRALNWLMKETGEDPIDYSLIAATVKYICQSGSSDDGSILIFLPGAMEIKRCIETIKAESGEQRNLELLPLHANLSNREQSAVFKRPRKGVRKVIVSTNIAETSITM
jgi:ATP-dependent RNA helicase DHX57